MAFDYVRSQNTALRLIARFGQSMPLVRLSSEYDPVTGEQSQTDAQVQAATVVTIPASADTVRQFDNRFKEEFKTGKIRFFYIAAKGLTFEPDAGDMFIYEGKLWDIEGVTPLNPAGVPVLYTMRGMVSGRKDMSLENMVELADESGLIFPKNWQK